jgi:hypothetical protein
LSIISDTLTGISTELGKQGRVLGRQGKKLEFVAKVVVLQHRLRLDIWSESKRSKEEQEAFKTSLITFYKRDHPSDFNLLIYMVLNEFFPRHLVIASHFWKHCTRGVELDEFGLLEDDQL